ncbi:phosphonopyruvate decarboxylase [Helicobacter sp. 11S03491-1]|uniref:phosphonopyruvate decarboxylase n=1 Tax=Helicobacter sp. 11S03491-1 TaxID=1476196 RepID=UPI000BA4EA8B|nr:phosphonopyruvate decarboxylase [Helicobacter sp. 11S03491-1]PAF43787.1 phosphonopyruvate decarboxylase [Helicobacter sp. 11S03491-1]
MLNTKDFGEILKQHRFVTFSGVPCSFLNPLINYAINENAFIMANNEGDGVAIASGISLNSKQTGVVLMQNSGLSNALSPLTSLNYTFKIPILGFVSLRGQQGICDEPQHELLGTITDKILKTCQIDYDFLSPDINIAAKQVAQAEEIINQNKSFFFIVCKDTFDSVSLQAPHFHQIGEKYFIQKPTKPTLPQRLEALEVIDSLNNKNLIVLATTGKTGRELYEINDSQNYLYMVGSMGCISSFGLGVSLENDKKVIAIDGDSALLMRMGNMSTNAYYAKGNFCHICLDNQSHDSTGGQFSLSFICNLAQIAYNCGYKKVFYANNLEDFKNALVDFINCDEKTGATFIYLSIQKGSKKDLGRPKIKPYEVKERLQNFLQENGK